MGIGPGYRHRHVNGYRIPDPPVEFKQSTTYKSVDPDPLNYRILDFKVFYKSVVLKIKYLDCTNYEGDKILVYRNTDLHTILTQEKGIDPHFNKSSDKRVYPFARFEPTEDGWRAAIALAISL